MSSLYDCQIEYDYREPKYPETENFTFVYKATVRVPIHIEGKDYADALAQCEEMIDAMGAEEFGMMLLDGVDSESIHVYSDKE